MNINRRFSNKDIFRLMVPLLLEQLLSFLVGVADTAMVSGAGEAAVSAVSLADSINILMNFLISAMAAGGAIVYAQSIGRGDEEYASKSVSQLLLTVTVVCVFFSVMLFTGKKFILNVLYSKTEADVMQNCITYFGITALSYPFIGIFSALSSLNRSKGNSKIGLKVSVVMNIINVSGNALCIFVFKMGVAGVAIPTLVSRIASAGIMIFISLKKDAFLPISKKLKSYRFDREISMSILKIGIPAGIENSLFQLARIGLSSLVSGLGTASVAAWAVVGHIAVLQYIPSTAAGMTLMTVGGQCFGAKEYDQIKYYIGKILKITYMILLGTIILLFTLANPIADIFNLSPEAKNMAVVMMYMSCFGVLIHPVAFPTAHTLRAFSDVKYTMVVSIASVWIFRLGLAYLLVYLTPLGVYGAWGAQFADWLCRAIFLMSRIKKHYKRWGV